MDKETKKIYEKYSLNPEEREIENLKIIKERYEKINSSNKKILTNQFKKGIEENFNSYKHYLQNPRFYYFTDLEYTIGEIVKCLIIEAHTAAITLTNHLLERILKLALIQRNSGTQPTETTDWNKTYLASDKYSGWIMNDTIKECKKFNIISGIEFEKLNNYRLSIRNGFSHYDPKKILKDSEDKIDLFQKSESEEMKVQGLNFKEIPMLQNFFIKKFARENAEEYFNFVFNIMLSIERSFKTEYYNKSK